LLAPIPTCRTKPDYFFTYELLKISILARVVPELVTKYLLIRNIILIYVYVRFFESVSVT